MCFNAWFVLSLNPFRPVWNHHLVTDVFGSTVFNASNDANQTHITSIQFLHKIRGIQNKMYLHLLFHKILCITRENEHAKVVYYVTQFVYNIIITVLNYLNPIIGRGRTNYSSA